jgi:uncharacterized membrane protein YhhN
MKKPVLFLALFSIALVGDILAIISSSSLQYVFKPAILLSLTAFYLAEAAIHHRLFLLALFFCWLGDVLLMFHGQLYFMLGLGAFLIGHACFIFTFRQLKWPQGKELLPTQRVRFIFPIILAATGLVAVLYPTLGALQIPVIVYAVVIMFMAITALLRLGFTNQASFSWVFVGAILFMISDSVLAINKFHTPFTGASVIIMVTYASAQFMIVKGILKHTPSH